MTFGYSFCNDVAGKLRDITGNIMVDGTNEPGAEFFVQEDSESPKWRKSVNYHEVILSGDRYDADYVADMIRRQIKRLKLLSRTNYENVGLALRGNVLDDGTFHLYYAYNHGRATVRLNAYVLMFDESQYVPIDAK